MVDNSGRRLIRFATLTIAATIAVGGVAAAPATQAAPVPAGRVDGPGNAPDPTGGVRPFATEWVPPTCPEHAPAGSMFVSHISARDLCERAESTAPTPQAAAAIRYAFAHLDSPYSGGRRYSTDPPMFDCSSLISRAFDAAGALISKNGQWRTWGIGGIFSYTGAYVPWNYQGTNLTRVASYEQLLPGDVIIEFNGGDPSGSVGDGGHAQIYLGDGLVIQSGGPHPDDHVNVAADVNKHGNAWYFRYNADRGISPVLRKAATFQQVLGQQLSAPEPAGAAGTRIRHANGVVTWSNRVGVRVVYGAIGARYEQLGGGAGRLNMPLTDERAGLVPGSRVSHFVGGDIHWSPATGAQEIYGSIWGRYLALGESRSPLRLPITGELPGAVPGSRMQEFQGGGIYWSAPTGAHEVYGGIGWLYRTLGADSGPLGLPLSGETPGPVPGSRMSAFQKGAIVWSPATGPVVITGSIGDLYRLRNLGPVLGMPVSPERDAAQPGSRVQDFARGRIYWSHPTGPHEVYGAILARYLVLGGDSSPLGLPTSGEYATPGGRASDFVGGRIVWDARTGATRVELR